MTELVRNYPGHLTKQVKSLFYFLLVWSNRSWSNAYLYTSKVRLTLSLFLIRLSCVCTVDSEIPSTSPMFLIFGCSDHNCKISSCRSVNGINLVFSFTFFIFNFSPTSSSLFLMTNCNLFDALAKTMRLILPPNWPFYLPSTTLICTNF